MRDKSNSRVPGYVDGALPDGLYHLTLSAGSVVDVAGNTLASDFTFDFAVLAADYNGNQTIDAADYVVWRKTLGDDVIHYSGADGSGNGHTRDGKLLDGTSACVLGFPSISGFR